LGYTVALKLKEEKFFVYPEASPKKIMEGRGERPKGRPAGNLGQRFDLVIWEKTTDNIKAVLEIKQAWDIAGLKSDREKISKFIKHKQYVKSGYLLAYTEAKGVKRVQTLENRLKNWKQVLLARLWAPISTSKATVTIVGPSVCFVYYNYEIGIIYLRGHVVLQKQIL
jgi:hypothetical protein